MDEAPPHVQAAIRSYAAFNARDLDGAVPELDEVKTCSTREQVQARLWRILEAFPDLRISDLRAYDLRRGRVAVRFVVSGTNTGPMGPGLAATGRHVRAEMVDLLEFDRQGRMIDGRRSIDPDVVGAQLGVVDG